MGKYYPLRQYLASTSGIELHLSFAYIERILKTSLPPSARQRPSWWSNNRTRHAQAEAWLNAGWETSAVEVNRQRLTFVRRAQPASGPKPRWEDVYGTMKGMLKVAPGVDLTEPAWPEWSAFLDKQYGPERKRRGAGR